MVRADDYEIRCTKFLFEWRLPHIVSVIEDAWPEEHVVWKIAFMENESASDYFKC